MNHTRVPLFTAHCQTPLPPPCFPSGIVSSLNKLKTAKKKKSEYRRLPCYSMQLFTFQHDLQLSPSCLYSRLNFLYAHFDSVSDESSASVLFPPVLLSACALLSSPPLTRHSSWSLCSFSAVDVCTQVLSGASPSPPLECTHVRTPVLMCC